MAVQDNKSLICTPKAIQKAAATYFEGLHRKAKEQLVDTDKYEKDNERKIARARRKRLYDGRKKYIREGAEQRIWSQIDQSMMSDEEETSEGFLRHSPQWRAEKLTILCRNLDERWKSDTASAKRQKRIDGTPSSRTPPINENLRPFIRQRDVED